MEQKPRLKHRGGVLVTVLFVVMAITVISLGLFARTDMNLACGKNLAVHMQMDALAHSGLEHAKALLIHPQGVDTSGAGYWQGQSGLQIETSGSDFYDLTITQAAVGATRRCTYTVQCQAYRMAGGQQVAQSRMEAELRLHPAVAYWQGNAFTLPAEATVNGDMYYNALCAISGTVNGDVYSSGSITNSGTVSGQLYPSQTTPTVPSPALSIADFTSSYYIESTSYTAGTLASGTITNQTFGPTGSNPAGIYYCPGNLTLAGTCQINGMLVVQNELYIADSATVTIQAVKNFPALLAGNTISFQGDNAALNVYGLAQVNQAVYFNGPGNFNNTLQVQGSLVILANGFSNPTGNTITITLDPALGAIQTWPTPGSASRWTPVAGGFFKGIQRF